MIAYQIYRNSNNQGYTVYPTRESQLQRTSRTDNPVTIQDRNNLKPRTIMGWVMVAILWTVLVHWVFVVAVKGFF